MSRKSTNYSPDFYDNQNNDKVDIKNTINSQQNGHAPSLVQNTKIENFASLANSSEEVERAPDVKVSNIIGRSLGIIYFCLTRKLLDVYELIGATFLSSIQIDAIASNLL